MPTTTYPASVKQVELITRLLGEKAIPEDCVPNTVRLTERLASGQVTGGKGGEASQVIDWLFTLPRKQAPGSANPVTEPGLYEKDGKVYKAQRSKTSGNLYAKVLETWVDEETGKSKARYAYAPGAFRLLDASNKIGLERANELSLQIGVCAQCGRTLTAKESVARGIGPICAGKV